MKATEKQIDRIKDAIKRAGRKFDDGMADDEIWNESVTGFIRSWNIPKETIDQNREDNQRETEKIGKAIDRALSMLDVEDVVENVSVSLGDKNYFDIQIKLK